MSKRLLWVVMVVFALGLTATAFAQSSVQTGNLNGTVKDETGAVLPGVTVTITSPAMIVPQLVTQTDEHGFFRFPAIPPGVYQVKFELEGFATLIRKGIVVSLGKTTTLNVAMKIAAVAETITVTGETPVVDKQSTTISVNFTTDLLRHLPSTRNMFSVFNFAPGVTGDTAHGSDVRGNAYNFDGVNLGDPVTGTPFFRIGFDAIEELEVSVGGQSAEYGNVQGAVVNAITKSGGNEFHGEEVLFYRNKSLQSDNTKGTPFEGQAVGFDHEYDWTLSLGGPFAKDKVWFYGNYWRYNSIEYVEGYVDENGASIPYDRMRYAGMFKVTYQPSAKDKFMGMYNRTDYQRHHRAASWQRPEDCTWIQVTPTNVYNGQWTHIFNDNMFLVARAAYVDFDFNLDPKNEKCVIYDYTTRMYSGSYGYYDHYQRNRGQYNGVLTYFVDNWYGKHEFKFGGEFEKSWDVRSVAYNTEYYYTDENGQKLGVRLYTRNGEPYKAYFYYPFSRKDIKRYYAAFAQDTWSLTNKLTINAGVRYERNTGIIPKGGFVEESYSPIAPWNTFSPRLGVTYDVFGDGKSVVKLSYGRYYAADIIQYFCTVNPNGWYYYRAYWYSGWDKNFNNNNFRIYDIYQQGINKTMDPNVKPPYTDQFVLSWEQELRPNIGVSFSAIYKPQTRFIEDVDIYLFDVDRGDWRWELFEPVTVTDPGEDGITGTADDGTITVYSLRPGNPAWQYYVTNPPHCYRNYWALQAVFNKRMADNWSLMVSYVYAHATGLMDLDFDATWTGASYFDNPNYHINAEGNLSLSRRHQLKITGHFILPYGIHVSTYWRVLSGRPYTRWLRVYGIEPDGNYDINVEPKGSRFRPTLNYGDIRVEKRFNLGKYGKVDVLANIFNVLNSNTATSLEGQTGSEFNVVRGILDPRIVQIAARFIF